MRTRKFKFKLRAAALACGMLALASGQAMAAEYWLRAGTTTVDMPNPNGGNPIQVSMWGYALCASGSVSATCGTVTVPGPALTVLPGDTELIVHLLNSLSVPTSLVVNGLIKPMMPTWDNGAVGPRPTPTGSTPPARVRSFDVEAAPNGTADYKWLAVKPGTYLYQSGTQVQVQVQMGLYGAVTKNAAVATTASRAQAYLGAAYEFDNETTLLYSEIDPDLHVAVAGGSYGPAGTMTSTVNYTPKYFLINGKPYQFGASVVEPVGLPGTTLVRLLNAGLTTHVPMIQGAHWDLIAEDGNPYPYKKTQYTALLPAAKTIDALLTPEIGATHPILDRRLSLSNNGLSDGGMLAFLRFASLGALTGGGQAAVANVSGQAPSNAAPVANPDVYDSVTGVTFSVAPRGVLENDRDDDSPIIKAVAASGTTSGGGSYTLNANGSFTYTPLASYTGPSDTFTYLATDGRALSVPGLVTINLTSPIAPSFTAGPLDGFNTPNATSLGASWLQQVGTTTSVPDLGIANNTATAISTALGGLAIWNPPSSDPSAPAVSIFGAKQGVSGRLSAGAYLVLKASGGSAMAPANYVRVGCEAGQIVVATTMGGSNVSLYTKQASLGPCSTTASSSISAVVDAKGLVTVFQGTTYAGGVQLPDVAAWTGLGRVGIQLTAVGATADDFVGGTLP